MPYNPVNAEELFRVLLARVPEFAPRYQSHLAENDELLPYVLMDDFSRFVLEANSAGNVDVWNRCIEFLNSSYLSQDQEVQLLIRSTFIETVETLWRARERFRAICNSLVPELRKAVRES